MMIKSLILLMAAALLAACGEQTNPIRSSTHVRVMIENDGPLGRELERKYGDRPVDWCGGKAASWCSGKLYAEIRDPEKVQALASFVNARLDGWGTPWSGAPVPEVKTYFYRGEELAGSFGSGPNFFARSSANMLSRKASAGEVRQFLELVGIEPAKLDRPPR